MLTLTARPQPPAAPPPPPAMPHASLAAAMAWLWRRLAPLAAQEKALPAAPSLSTPKRARGKCDAAIVLRLDAATHAWLAAQAAEHTAGSLHKAIKDLLAWACDATGDDHDWLFDEAHRPLPPLPSPCAREVPVSARLDGATRSALRAWERRYAMAPAALLDAVCRAAVELDATADVFASLEAGMAFPRRSADLYADLGILPRPR